MWQRALRTLVRTLQELLSALIYGIVFLPFVAIGVGAAYVGLRVAIPKALTVVSTPTAREE